MILLDTSFLIRSLVAGSAQDRQLRHWLADKEPIGISSIAWAEFLCGPVQPTMIDAVTRFVTVRAVFDEEDALLAAQLFNGSGHRRGSLADCMIAATAIRARAALATSNVADFRRFCAAGRSLPIDARHGGRLFHRHTGPGVRNLEFERQLLLGGHLSQEDAHRIRKEAGLLGNLLIL